MLNITVNKLRSKYPPEAEI